MTENIWQKEMKWAYYIANEYCLPDSNFRNDALKEAREIMRRARRNIEQIISRLKSRNYQFVSPNLVYSPSKLASGWVKELAEQGIHIPISLQAWMEEIGIVDLRGTDPQWPFSGYHGLDSNKEVWHTDPLYIHVDIEFIYDEYENWKWSCKEDGYEEVGPFCISISPDDLHKANISGGAPYELNTTKASVDSILLNERHCHSFISYIRHSLHWGGFPGFEIIEEKPKRFLEEMTNDLDSV